jgi:hypothetical protein
MSDKTNLWLQRFNLRLLSDAERFGPSDREGSKNRPPGSFLALVGGVAPSSFKG